MTNQTLLKELKKELAYFKFLADLAKKPSQAIALAINIQAIQDDITLVQTRIKTTKLC
jgi:hypothetical protein